MYKTYKEIISAVYTKHYKQLVNYAYFRVSDYGLAEELVQESFLKTWNYGLSLNIELLKPKSFIYRVLKNLIIDFYKKNQNQELSLKQVNEHKISSDLIIDKKIDNKIDYELALKSINNLDKKYKSILIYRYIEGMNIEKICQKTGLSPNYVSVLLYRGINILKKSLTFKNGQASL